MSWDTGKSSEASTRVTYSTVTVRKIGQDFKAPHVIHYLSLDVKGSEFLVPQTFDAHRVLVITIERPDLCWQGLLQVCCHRNCEHDVLVKRTRESEFIRQVIPGR